MELTKKNCVCDLNRQTASLQFLTLVVGTAEVQHKVQVLAVSCYRLLFVHKIEPLLDLVLCFNIGLLEEPNCNCSYILVKYI